jgi:hypothetical protein
VKKDNPEAKMTEITKIISEMWNNLDKNKKGELDALYLKNKERYNKDKDAYEKKYGQIQSKRKKSSKTK